MGKTIETLFRIYTKDIEINLEQFKTAKDISFKNIGTTDCRIMKTVGSDYFPLIVGDPMVTFGGYDNTIRNDEFKITFTGGTGLIVALITTEDC